jgi:hypothetical protein
MLRDGKEGDMLYIGIMFRMVGDEVMDVVVLSVQLVSEDLRSSTYIAPPS